MVQRLSLAALCGALALPALADQADPFRPATGTGAKVTVSGDTLSYIGGIEADGLLALRAALAEVPKGQITRMVVNSGGGDTKVGIEIGGIIADLAPDLTIETGCFSSCADFIAPAAKSITLRENAFLGWHGNDRQFAVIEAQTGVPQAEQFRKIFTAQAGPGVDVEPSVREATTTIAALVASETALYAKIGLKDDRFAVCGVGTRFDDRLTGTQRGWGFSIADMARLGLPPVRYLGPTAYEDNPAFRRYLIRLTPEDCEPFKGG